MTPYLLVALLLSPQPPKPVIDVTEADLAPGRVCAESSDCDCYTPAGTDTWTLRRCVSLPRYEPPVEDTLKDPQVSVVGGATAVLDTFGSKVPVKPFASVMVDWSLAGEYRRLDAFVQADYTGLPDPNAKITLTNPGDFDAVVIELGWSYRPSVKISASGYCSGGFASRFVEGTVEPHTSAPLWGSCGLAFRDRGEHRARLRIGLGPDERLGYGWTMAAHVKGSIRLTGIGGSRVGVTLLADVILGLETPTGQDQRVNVATTSVAMSWDSNN